MGRTVSNRGKTRYIAQAKAFAKQGDREKNILRPEYRWIVDYIGRYFCDQKGEIYSVCQKRAEGAIRVMAQHPNSRGYMRWSINCISPQSSANRRHKPAMVAREVLKAWKGEPKEESFQCAHMDDDKLNNEITNLRWTKRGVQGDLKRIMTGTASQDLYINGSNRLDAEWNRAMKQQWKTMQSHLAECSCLICKLKHLPEAVPLSLRKGKQTNSRL